MMRAITPKAVDNREWFKMDEAEGKEGFSKGEGMVDDKVESH